MESSAILYLKDMLSAVNKVLVAAESFENINDLRKNSLLFDIIIMNLVVIAEIDQKLGDNSKQVFSFIAWEKIKLFKDQIQSDYFELDLKIIWLVITEHLPLLKSKLEKIVNDIN